MLKITRDKNPILTLNKDVPWMSVKVFNPGVAFDKGKFRIGEISLDLLGGVLGVAGAHIKVIPFITARIGDAVPLEYNFDLLHFTLRSHRKRHRRRRRHCTRRYQCA